MAILPEGRHPLHLLYHLVLRERLEFVAIEMIGCM